MRKKIFCLVSLMAMTASLIYFKPDLMSLIAQTQGYKQRQASLENLTKEYESKKEDLYKSYDKMKSANNAIDVTNIVDVATAISGDGNLSFLDYSIYNLDNTGSLVEIYRSEDLTTLKNSMNGGIIISLRYNTKDPSASLSNIESLRLPIDSITYSTDTSVLDIKIINPKGVS